MGCAVQAFSPLPSAAEAVMCSSRLWDTEDIGRKKDEATGLMLDACYLDAYSFEYLCH